MSGTESDGDGESVLDLLDDWYHVPALLVTAAFMLWVRLQTYDNFVTDDGIVFSGNDAWYHLREVNYTVRHWPGTMPFDPWTFFPFGTSTGQFGTVYDQIVATAALIVGLGSPSDQLIAKTLLVAPPVFGALALIPTYLIGRRLVGRGAAVFGVVVLALLPGTFLRRTLVGFADHNGAEPFFMGLAVAALLYAFAVAERERPVWELLAAPLRQHGVADGLAAMREEPSLRAPAKWAVVAGAATALYMWAWPPGVLLVGIVGVFLLLKLPSDYVNDRSPDHLAFAVAVSMGTTAVLMLVPLQQATFSATDFSLLQILLPAGVAGAAVAYAWFARLLDDADVAPAVYPAAVFGSVVVGVGAMAVAVPDLFSVVVANLQRTVGFSSGAQTRTIAEAQPYLSPDVLQRSGYTTESGAPDRIARVMADYGFALFSGVAAAIWMAARPLIDDGRSRQVGYAVGGLVVIALIFVFPAPFGAVAEGVGTVTEIAGLATVAAVLAGATLLVRYDAERLFFLVWAGFVTAAAFTQVRFNYYLVLVVATSNAFLLGAVLRYVNVDSFAEAVSDVEGYQLLTIVAVLMLVTMPGLVVSMQVRNPGLQNNQTQPVWMQGQQNGPGNYVRWSDSLEWLENNSPEEGNLGGAGNQDDFGYYDRYERTDDFEYPNGTYGVQSWWDYGHWITLGAERVPNANPFQQGAGSAANYLLAPNESAAEETLAARSTEGERTRYVMVDWQMATPGSKFAAPTVFYDRSNLSARDFYSTVYRVGNGQGSARLNPNVRVFVRDQRFYESQMTRLYYYHGSAQSPLPLVVDWEARTAQYGQGQVRVNGTPANGSVVRTDFRSMDEARDYVERDRTAQVGGIGPYPEEFVPALEHYRLVDVSSADAIESRSYFAIQRRAVLSGVPQKLLGANPTSFVKTFERVPGARVEGEGAMPNATVTAEVEMEIPDANTSFVYSQRAQADENGEFNMTLPYATTGYDEYGPAEGYTDTSLHAAAPYNVSGGTRFNDSGYVIARRGTLNVSESVVVGAEDRTLDLSLERRSEPVFTDLPGEDAGNGTTTGGATTATTGGANATAAGGPNDGSKTTTPNGTSAALAAPFRAPKPAGA